MVKKIVSFLSLVVSDFLTILLCFILAYFVRNDILPFLHPPLHQRPVLLGIYVSQFYMFSVWAIVFMYEKLYTKRFAFRDESRLLLKGSSISFALIMIAVFLTQQYLRFSRAIIILAWLFSLVLLPFSRYLTKSLLIRLNLWKKKVIIIGSSNSSAPLVEIIRQNSNLGYDIVGCFTDDVNLIGGSISGVKILGHMDAIEEWKEKAGFEDIIVTLPDIPRERLVELMKKWDRVSETIRYIPPTGDLITTGVEIENIGRLLALTVRKNLSKPWNILIKSAFEYFVGSICLVICIPVFIVIGMAIKLDSRGPVFFIQERFGRKGKRIKLIKFRSMFQDAELRLQNYFQANPSAEGEWAKFKKLKTHDPRVTGVGRFLRKYSLDELPQLLNVVKGDMSLAGPRPYILEEIAELESVKFFLLQVKPGITGLWQISGRSLVAFQERLNIDEYYIRNWSFWLDCVILMKTVRVSLSGKGAF